MSFYMLGTKLLALAISFRVATTRRASVFKIATIASFQVATTHRADIEKHDLSSDPISCDMSKWVDSPLKWGAEFEKIPVGVVNGAGNASIPAFMGKRGEAIQGTFTDKEEESGEKILMRLKEVCCGGPAVESYFGHHAAEGHWYYSHTLRGFEEEIRKSLSEGKRVVFRCSVCGTPLFVLNPENRTADEFLEESFHHGWPSFRDTDIYFDEETGEMNLQTYDVPYLGFGNRPYPEEKRTNAVKALVARGGDLNLAFINEWKKLEETKGPHKIWQSPDFEVHCKHCGAHVGHANPNAPPDSEGNRYCIDAGCVAK